MRNTRWAAVAGAMAATLLATGCGGGSGTGGTAASATPATSVAATTPVVFDQRAVYEEIMAVAVAAELPDTHLPGIGGPASGPSPTPSTEEERLEERGMSCTAAWSVAVPPGDRVRDEYDKVVDTLIWKGWTAGKPHEEKAGGKRGTDTIVRVTLKKRGWTLIANYNAMGGGVLGEILFFMATEDTCMEQFTEEELDRLFSKGGEQP
ncbi:hypothetical protein ACFQ7J_17195 [Streptomyces sp. NPDC056501]|uniref:hypothetical protein n=1 Tax=Streptomyces sp. NPDC056501 TaxID=3345841 RepID=UPI0036994F6B